MKNLVKLTVVAVLLTANSMNSQSTPVPPMPPNTASVTVENTSTSYSRHSNSGKQNSSSSISVKGTNSSYKLRAYFDNDLTVRVRKFLQKELKGKRFTNTNDSSFWTIIKNNEKVFECKVREGLVRMYINKEMTSKKFQNEIEEIGERLKYLINGGSIEDAKKQRKASAKRRLEQAKRQYENAKRNYEREK